jgi:hypothetical protein
MTPHTHMSATHAVTFVAFTVAVLGTIHLLAVGADNRLSRAFLALGL